MRSPVRAGVLLAAAAVVAALATPAAAAPAAPAGGLSARTVSQIAALGQAKLARTAPQRKVDSRLLAESAQRRGSRVAGGVGTVRTGVEVDRAGRVTVDVRGRTGRALADAVTAAGGRVLTAQPARGTLRATLPLTAVEPLAARAEVERVGVAGGATTARVDPGRGGAVTGRVDPNRGGRAPAADRARIAKAGIDAALRKAAVAKKAGPAADAAVTPLVGALTSEGDVTHAVDRARATRKVSGVGIKVGVLSDGVDSLAASQATGDLPPNVEVLDGQAGFGDEGTAMLEIVHDLAPNADLVFASAFASAESFADNIRALRAAGADIIVDDVIYFAESPFQDGPIAQAVIDVTNDGALYFSSAGNQGNVDDGTAGNWEGMYTGSGQQIGKFLGEAHDFDPTARVQPYDPMSGLAPVVLQWADPLGHAVDDYDEYAIDPDGNVVGFSNSVQDGDDDPLEVMIAGGDVRIVVVKFSGAARYLQVTAFGAPYLDQGDTKAFVSPGSIRGHAAVKAAVAVAAVPAAEPLPFEIAPGVANPSGPYPGQYTRAQRTEVFTADGPRRLFFRPDGTPIPGGGEVRAKPDLTAADGVQTTVPFFERFYGTSASAPHAAAIAALVLSGNPGIAPAAVKSAMTGSAIDIEKPGRDRDTGAGIVMATRTLAVTGATPQPYVVAGDPQVTPVTGDGDAYLEPGESGDLAVPLTNIGDTVATAVSAQLATTTPGLTITPTTRAYGRIPAGATVSRTFRVTVAGSYEPGRPADLRVRVAFVGAFSPTTRTSRIVPGEPSADVLDVAYTGPALPIPDSSAEPVVVSAPLPVSGIGRISRLTVSVDGTDCTAADDAPGVGLEHTFVSDLVGTLVAPDGTRTTLFANIDQDANNLCQVVFDDSATRSIQTADGAEAPFTGSWQPADPLSSLLGTAGDGTWSFEVEDLFPPEDGGALRAVSLHVSGYEPGPTG